MSGDIICQRCGWRNEAAARRCGGCGRPLREAELVGAGAQVPPAVGWSPTVPLATPSPGANATPPPFAGWPSPIAARPAPRRGNMWRGLLVVVALAAIVLAIAWSAVIRPAIHAQVDGQLRSLLAAGVQQAAAPLAAVPKDQPVPTLQITVTAADLTTQLRSQIPDSSPLKDVAVSFAGGRMVIAYTVLGRQGDISTALTATGQRIVARDTRVNGPLGLVENGAELQSALDTALGEVPDTVPVQQVSADADTLIVIVGS